MLIKRFTIAFFLLISLRVYPTFEEIQKAPTQKKHHILYLVQSNKIDQAISSYKEYTKTHGKHDFEILESMGIILLDQAMDSADPEKQLIALYGASLANSEILLDLCEKGSHSQSPTTQMVSVQLAGRIQDDRSDTILTRALSSKYLAIRMESAFSLAGKKHKSAVGYIESLMAKLPPFFHSFFSEMYAMVGTQDGNRVLKKLMNDRILSNRLSAILAAAKFGRDDFIKDIRTIATHKNPAEQEACASALGFLGDSHSIEKLKELSNSLDQDVQLSALRSLQMLGQNDSFEKIEKLAEDKNLFAISTLALFDKPSKILTKLLDNKDELISYNAALSLLRKKDPRCLPVLKKMFLTKRLDIGFLPHFSNGRSLYYFKPMYSISAHAKKNKNPDLLSAALAFRQNLLVDALELEFDVFLDISDFIFTNNIKDLIPTCVQLLCNVGSEKAVNLLKKNAEKAGAPFTRTYCYLGLYKLKTEKNYSDQLLDWIEKNYKTEMVRFKPVMAKANAEANLVYELTPEESSSLLIGAYSLISQKQSEKSLDILLEGIQKGHEKNRAIMAGLLLKAIE